jgi:prepilin signal peptidase PulO-like enzyme (type II secretory pathway)
MYNFILICFCIGIAIIDLKTFRIPNFMLAAFALVVIIMEGSLQYSVLIERLGAALVSFVIFSAVWYYSKGIGFGDVKYAALLGYILGPEKLMSAFLITAFLGIFIYLIGILLLRWEKTTKIPYAPFLSAGAILTTGGVL